MFNRILTKTQAMRMSRLINEKGYAHDDALLTVMTRGQRALWMACQVIGLLTIFGSLFAIWFLYSASK